MSYKTKLYFIQLRRKQTDEKKSTNWKKKEKKKTQEALIQSTTTNRVILSRTLVEKKHSKRKLLHPIENACQIKLWLDDANQKHYPISGLISQSHSKRAFFARSEANAPYSMGGSLWRSTKNSADKKLNSNREGVILWLTSTFGVGHV